MLKALRTGLTLVTALALSACTVHQTEVPPLAGPSENALAVRVTATPDSLALDGGSQSSIVVEARDANGAPRSGLAVRLDIAVGNVFEDCGQLSARNIVTGSDGRATSIFTAPAMPLPLPQCQGFSPGGTVTISAIPSGNNFQASSSNLQTATIRLVPLGVILPPPSTPAPCMTVSPSLPTANTPINFTAGTRDPVSGVCRAASSDIVTFAWDFGDGGRASGQTATHTFTIANTYNVTLTETNDRAVAASVTQALAVGAPALPVATFNFSPAAPGIGETVFFNASASTAGVGHTISTYRWAFGDGGSSTGVTTSHAYPATGSYTVTLTVTDESGQSANNTAQVPVGTATPAPVAVFTFSPQTPTTTQVVVFDSSTSRPSGQGQTIVDYAWTFGDNTVGQHTSQKTIAHTFSTAGTFAVNLVVTDNVGRTASISATIVVTASVAAAARADFTFTPATGTVNQQVDFDGGRSSPSAGATRIVSWSWNFGDAPTVFTYTFPTVPHTWTQAGTYFVTLTVTDDFGRTGTISKTIIVQ